MAEVVFNDLLKSKKINPKNWIVKSAGLHAMVNLPAVPMAQEVCRLAGYDLRHHLSTPLSKDLMESFNLVLVMEKWQVQQIQQLYPNQSEKTCLLSEMSGIEKDILDPFGTTLNTHKDTLQEITQYLIRGFSKILSLA